MNEAARWGYTILTIVAATACGIMFSREKDKYQRIIWALLWATVFLLNVVLQLRSRH